MKSKKSTRLGQILLEKGLLSSAQLDIAVKEQMRRRQDAAIGTDLNASTSLGEILIELGFIDRLALNRGLHWQSALRKIAVVMSFCAPLMTASYSAAAATAGAFAQPTFIARSSSSSADSNVAPSFTKSSSSKSSASNDNAPTSSVPGQGVAQSSPKSSSSKSSAAPVKGAGPDLIAPQMPNKVSVIAALHDRVHLSWAAATDNVAVTRYRVYRDQMQLLESDKIEFVDYNVAPGKSYLYGVSAGDAVGNWSAIKSVFVLTAAAPVGVKVVSSSSASSVASSSNSSVANSVASSSSKAPTFTPSSSSLSSVVPSSSASSLSSKAASSSIAPSSSKSSSSTSSAVSSSSSSKAVVSSSSSSISSSAASSASSVAGPVNLNWTPPVARENGNVLDITEVGGYELRYRKIADNAYTYVTINDAWTNTYNFPWLEGNYVFQIAAFDKNGLYSNFVDLAPK